MAETVKPDRRQPCQVGQPQELVGDVLRVQAAALWLGEYEPAVSPRLSRGILAGVLLGRGEVQRWSLSTVAVRVVRQPPDGTAFDLRSAALRQSRGKFGCLVIVVTVLMLLVVGAIGATLPADRGTDSPNYIAFMVGVVLVVLAGVAGYVWIDVRARAMGVLTVTDRHLNEHPWSRVRSVALSWKGEAAVVNGVRRHRSARLDLSFYDEPDERHPRLPDDATLHGAIAAALAAHSPLWRLPRRGFANRCHNIRSGWQLTSGRARLARRRR